MMAADFVAHLLFLTKCLLGTVGIVFLISGLDDFFVDLCYWATALYRRVFVWPKHPRLTEEQLRDAAEKPIAIMIPAWDESAVIRRMLQATIQTLDYSNYHVFVGTYPNDPATQREVEIMREQHPHVHRVVCPQDGPTCKSDCMNWIYQGIRHFEKENDVCFEVFVMNDSEDIVHPLCLKLFNFLIPRKDMVQLPVFPLETRWTNFTSGHYLDEFAENHTKDLVVRERLSGFVPGAGVGCGFSRHALETMAANCNNQIFNLDTLTEDYDFAFRLSRYGIRGVFVRQAVDRTVTRKSFWTGELRQVNVKEPIAIREYFPSSFKAAVRQKGRWIVGIALQGWAQLGWKGSFWTKYMMYRDRKGLVTNFVGVLGYVVVLTVVSVWVARWLFPESYRYPPIVERGTWLWYLVLLNAFFLSVRLLQRAICVGRLYGWRQALLSAPRQVWGNFVNFAAAGRAVYLFSRSLLTGKLIAWDKTAHVFPSEEELVSFRRRLGDLLLEKRLLTVQHLEEAVRRQSENHLLLGSILVGMEAVDEGDLLHVLSNQLGMIARDIDPQSTPLYLLRRVPRDLSIRYSVYPIEETDTGKILLATERPLGTEEREAIEAALDVPVDLCLATTSDLAFAIRYGYERLEAGETRPLLGSTLVERGVLSRENLVRALVVQRRAYARLGDILLEKGRLSSDALKGALGRYRPEEGRLGEFLLQNDYVSQMDLEQALIEQKKRSRRLGDILGEEGMFSEDNLRKVSYDYVYAMS